MNTVKFNGLLLLVVFGASIQGCSTPKQTHNCTKKDPLTKETVDYNDPVLNNRKVLLFGSTDAQTAEVLIQKLLYLDSKAHEPIDLFIQSPGGNLKGSFAIEQAIRLLQSPVNTYALSECNSGRAMLLAAGTGKRYAFKGSMIILHGMKINGEPPAEAIDMLQDSYTEFWKKQARLPESWLPLPFDSTRVLSAEQALEYGIVDQVIDR